MPWRKCFSAGKLPKPQLSEVTLLMKTNAFCAQYTRTRCCTLNASCSRICTPDRDSDRGSDFAMHRKDAALPAACFSDRTRHGRRSTVCAATRQRCKPADSAGPDDDGAEQSLQALYAQQRSPHEDMAEPAIRRATTWTTVYHTFPRPVAQRPRISHILVLTAGHHAGYKKGFTHLSVVHICWRYHAQAN